MDGSLLSSEVVRSLRCSKHVNNIALPYCKVKEGLYNTGTSKYKSDLQSYLSKTHEITDVALGNGVSSNSFVTCMDIDPVEDRYVITGRSSGGITIHDTYISKQNKKFPLVGRIKGGVQGTHNDMISCVQWYPVDAGLFSTSSYDKCVKIWDPNLLKLVEEFTLDCEIVHHHMSPVASNHSLLAVAGTKGDVILCDLRSGSSTHRLTGHTESVSYVQWARHQSNILVSGGKDKTIRVWDVRSSKSSLKILNSNLRMTKAEMRMKVTPAAHNQRINSLIFTYDGLFLISFSSDGALYIWSTSTWSRWKVDFGPIDTTDRRPLQMAVTPNYRPDLIYVPSKRYIAVYNIQTGAMVNLLDGHFSSLYGLAYNRVSGDLYSCASDKNFVVWTPRQLLKEKYTDDFHDNWSSDEDNG